MYQNRHTNNVLKLDHVEVVKSNPEVTVYVFENGERWCAKDFFEHWFFVG